MLQNHLGSLLQREKGSWRNRKKRKRRGSFGKGMNRKAQAKKDNRRSLMGGE